MPRDRAGLGDGHSNTTADRTSLSVKLKQHALGGGCLFIVHRVKFVYIARVAQPGFCMWLQTLNGLWVRYLNEKLLIN